MAKQKINPLFLIILIGFLIFGITTIFSVNKINFSPYITSNFVGKTFITNNLLGHDPNSISDFNYYIENYHGYAIFETPIVGLDFSTTDNSAMKKECPELATFLESKKGKYEISDLELFNSQINTCMNHLCDTFPSIIPNDISTDIAIKFCQKKPSSLFIKSGNTYNLASLDDLDVPVGNTTQKLLLSKLRVQMTVIKGNLFVGVNKGIEEMNSIESNYNFAQYGYSINSTNCDLYSYAIGKCIVISNNDALVSASKGEIEKSNSFSDLWYGLLNSKNSAFLDTKMIIFYVIIGLFFLWALLRK